MYSVHCGLVVPGRQACTSPATDLRYWLYLPAAQAPREKLPLLVYLHGFSHSGSNLDRLLSGGVPAELESGRELPMVVVSPQCPKGDNWQYAEMVERLSRLVAEVVAGHDLDAQRVYLTGFSMGGDGVWALGLAHPEQFAALAPVASDWGADPQAMCALQGVPVWVFQSEKDQLVSPRHATSVVGALKQCGGEVQLTLFPDAGHEGTSRIAYSMDEMYEWFLEQRSPHDGLQPSPADWRWAAGNH